jgi:hypothetical protein
LRCLRRTNSCTLFASLDRKSVASSFPYTFQSATSLSSLPRFFHVLTCKVHILVHVMVQNVSIQFAKLFRHHADLFRICNSSHKPWNNRSLTSCTPGRQTHARPLFRLTSPPVCSDQIDADLDRQVLPGLTDRALLEKIDKLRELNVKSLELPQVHPLNI